MFPGCLSHGLLLSTHTGFIFTSYVYYRLIFLQYHRLPLPEDKQISAGVCVSVCLYNSPPFHLQESPVLINHALFFHGLPHLSQTSILSHYHPKPLTSHPPMENTTVSKLKAFLKFPKITCAPNAYIYRFRLSVCLVLFSARHTFSLCFVDYAHP